MKENRIKKRLSGLIDILAFRTYSRGGFQTRPAMTCFRCGYCCTHVDITARDQYGFFDGSNIPVAVIKELADLGMPIRGKCDNLKMDSGEMIVDHCGERVKLIGDIYSCGIYAYRHEICRNEVIHVSRETLSERLDHRLPVPRCKVAEAFGIAALARCHDVSLVEIPTEKE